MYVEYSSDRHFPSTRFTMQLDQHYIWIKVDIIQMALNGKIFPVDPLSLSAK